MNDNDSGTRSFEPVQKNTVQTEPPQKPAGKPDLKKIITIAIFSVVIVLILIFCAIIITEIVYKVGGGNASSGAIRYKAENISSSDYKKGSLLVINSTNAFAAEKNPGIANEVREIVAFNNELKRTDTDTVIYYGVGTKGPYKLVPEAIKQLNKFTAALYEATGVNDLLVSYAYTTTDLKGYDLEHVLGTVVDLKRENGVTLAKDANVLSWMNAHCTDYGFINTDLSGSVHDSDASVPTTQFRYVGVAHSTYMAKNNLTFGAYLAMLKSDNVSPSKPLTVDTANGGRYAVYYIAAQTGENTELKVPENFDYTVSGDNLGGFIITVDLSKNQQK